MVYRVYMYIFEASNIATSQTIGIVLSLVVSIPCNDFMKYDWSYFSRVNSITTMHYMKLTHPQMFRIIIGCKTFFFFFLDTIKRLRTLCVCFSFFSFCVYFAQAVINAGLVPLIIAVLKVCKHDTNSLCLFVNVFRKRCCPVILIHVNYYYS